ncbi:SLC5A9 [Mytilus coruscus]|uniref:SLC5A9 n=1 Tax=Mytilus coruscus TaxID=42192 RepID=A0A6J8B7G3_MYTCO|nr:SLC5A9 [Mytilus coruscus]
MGVETKYMESAANYTMYNDTYYSCGLPRKDAMHMFRDPIKGDIPWTGALTGLSVLGMYNWCQDQVFIIFKLIFKGSTMPWNNILPFYEKRRKDKQQYVRKQKVEQHLIILSKAISARNEIACADPDKCYEYCGNKAGCSNIAYPLLVMRLMPAGLRGLMLAALLAALMSSLTSILNSACSIMTMDVWRQFRKHASQAELMIVGRVTVLILVGLSILWIPVLQEAQSGMFWFYMQSIRSYFVPPMCVLFLLALFWKRLTEQGAFWGLMLSLVIGVIWLALDFIYPAPRCGSGEENTRLSILKHVDFLHFASILTVLSTIFMVVISLLSEPRPDRKLHRVTWWTKDDTEDPDLSSDYEDDELVPEIKTKKSVDGTRSVIMAHCKAWICGTIDDSFKYTSPEERERLHQRMTSISEKSRPKIILNVFAIGVSILTVGLLIFFH